MNLPSRFRVGLQDVSQEEFATAVREQFGKQSVSIMLDSSIIAFFKAKATDCDYQTLINQTLHEVMQIDLIESTLRRIIREELRHGVHSSS